MPAMNPRSMRDFLDKYFDEYRGLAEPSDDVKSVESGASDYFQEILRRRDAPKAWQMVCALVDAAPSQDALAFVSASALEDFVREFGDTHGALILKAARESDRMRTALGGVWGWARYSQTLRAALADVIVDGWPSS